ncbi:MAG TPA: hypothetical protein VGG19_15810 [Tepidisphaeraceae bacterium]|jgi:hypothetical protein
MADPIRIRLTRQELYEKVWSTPCIKLAAEFRISDVLIGKICAKHQIPKPPPGYWAKLAHGAAMIRPPLPSIDDPSLAFIEITPDAGASQKIPPGEGGLKHLEESLPENKIVVGQSLDDPRPLIRATRRSLRAASPDSDGFCSPGAKECLNVRVS